MLAEDSGGALESTNLSLDESFNASSLNIPSKDESGLMLEQ